jgi:hypothetical protein
MWAVGAVRPATARWAGATHHRTCAMALARLQCWNEQNDNLGMQALRRRKARHASDALFLGLGSDGRVSGCCLHDVGGSTPCKCRGLPPQSILHKNTMALPEALPRTASLSHS